MSSPPPKKSLGQNFLKNPRILAEISSTAEISAADHIVEIGPGLGHLTQILAQKAGKITAVELDSELIPKLKEKFSTAPIVSFPTETPSAPLSFPTGCNPDRESIASKTQTNITILHQDILQFIPPKTPYKLVGNIPYYITSPILNHFLKNEWLKPEPHPPELIVLTVQKEVAEKICAAPGRLNVLALDVQLFGQPKFIFEISRKHFKPSPKVNSALIKITPYPKPKIAPEHLKKAFHFIHACFSQKRKKIINPLSGLLQIPKETLTLKLEKAGLDPAARPQHLTIEDWEKLTLSC